MCSKSEYRLKVKNLISFIDERCQYGSNRDKVVSFGSNHIGMGFVDIVQ